MNRETYGLLENFMLCCMEDAAHDKEHSYRVLYNALEIAKTEHQMDYDVLTAACLLHDIGRKEQFENPAVCHAMAGGEKAYQLPRPTCKNRFFPLDFSPNTCYNRYT